MSAATLAEATEHVLAGQFGEAESCCRQVLRDQPGDAGALHLLGTLACARGNQKIALAFLSKAVALNEANPTFRNSLGVAFLQQGRSDDALECLKLAVDGPPRSPVAQLNLGAALLILGRGEEAAGHLREFISLEPSSADAHLYLGFALLSVGAAREAAESFQRARQCPPASSSAVAGVPTARISVSQVLFASHYTSLFDQASYRTAARAWARVHAAPIAGANITHRSQRRERRRLRIGYVSGDFSDHTVGRMVRVVLAKHDHSEFEIFGYANQQNYDHVTEQIKAATDHWRNIDGVNDESVAELIQRDGIDILVDLSGHTNGHRLALFARKPAPVQATWLGYFDSTGVESIDYLVADRLVCPPGDERGYVEKIVRLPDSFLCYAAPAHETEDAPMPALRRGFVTFGSLNNIAKVSPDVITAWAAILATVPHARLLLKSAALEDARVRQRYTEAFANAGIDQSRLVLEGETQFSSYLAAYHDIDIALDPYPYNGGATTLDALWMGVPVVTLRGQRFVGRMGASLLTSVGLESLIAETPAEYVAKAVALASERGDLARLRATLRRRVREAPLGDPARFTRGLEGAYRSMWSARQSAYIASSQV